MEAVYLLPLSFLPEFEQGLQSIICTMVVEDYTALRQDKVANDYYPVFLCGEDQEIHISAFSGQRQGAGFQMGRCPARSDPNGRSRLLRIAAIMNFCKLAGMKAPLSNPIILRGM